MVSRSNRPFSSSALPVLILEGLALLGFGLAFTTEHWSNTTGSPPASAVLGAIFIFLAICVSIVAAIILLSNIIVGKIDMGTIIAFMPFCGFAIWGIWYSYTDISWVHNVPIYWGILGVIIVLWLYTTVRYLRRKQ